MSLRQDLCRRLSAIGLEQKLVHRLTDTICKWHRNNGPEWTVSHLKCIKQLFLSRLTGDPYMGNHWLSLNKDGMPKGPFGSLSLRDRRHSAKAINAVMAYSLFVSDKPTKSQKQKFFGSVEGPNISVTKRDADVFRTRSEYRFSDDFARESFIEDLIGSGTNGISLAPLSTPRVFTEFPWSGTKRAPIGNRSVPESNVPQWLLSDMRDARINQFCTLLKELSVPSGLYQYAMQIEPSAKNMDSSMGRVAYLQEAGFKLRAIANPRRSLQVLLDPLKQAVMGGLKSCEQDCTHDQQSGIDWVQEQLCQDQVVHCYDLSDATNHFPLSFQLSVMSKVLPHDKRTKQSLYLFSHASRGEWKVPDDNRKVRWTRGQPLGLAPSFGCFAMSHLVLLRGLSAKVGGDFRIIGDDVAIVGDRLASSYRKVMAQLRVPINDSKSLVSDKLAEFGGRLIDKEGTIPTPKWRTVSDRSFLDILRLVGPTGMGLLRPRQRKVAKAILSLPEWMGGLGWNPKGLSMEQRVEQAYSLGLLDRTEREIPYRDLLSSHNRILNRIWYEANLSYEQVRKPDPTPTRSRYHTILDTIGVTQGSMPEELLGGKYRSMSPEGGDPRGPTMLEVLESRLQMDNSTPGPR